MRLSYIAQKDELVLKICPTKKGLNKKFGPFELWWDDKEGNICQFAISKYTEELEEFKNNINTTCLGGLWKGLKINEKDIQEARQELLQRLLEKW